jgi:hypothetical protein
MRRQGGIRRATCGVVDLDLRRSKGDKAFPHRFCCFASDATLKKMARATAVKLPSVLQPANRSRPNAGIA